MFIIDTSNCRLTGIITSNQEIYKRLESLKRLLNTLSIYNNREEFNLYIYFIVIAPTICTPCILFNLSLSLSLPPTLLNSLLSSLTILSHNILCLTLFIYSLDLLSGYHLRKHFFLSLYHMSKLSFYRTFIIFLLYFNYNDFDHYLYL